MFEVGVSPLELFVRGTALYLFLFAVFRVVIKRRIGSVGLADILVVVLIADAAQNGISGEYRSITEAFVVVGTIVGWTVLIDWLCYRVPALQGWLEPPPLLLIDRGRVLWRHLRVEFMSGSELESKLREHGITDPAQVEKAYLEPDGQFTVIRRRGSSTSSS